MNSKAHDALIRAWDETIDRAVKQETETLRAAGAVLLRVIYESGIAYDNPEVESALSVFAAGPNEEPAK